jgi:thioredoxin 1
MIEHLTKTDFLSRVFDFEKKGSWQFEGRRPAIIDFWAEWCPPCKMISPILEDLASQYTGKVDIFKVNADEQPEIASVFNVLSLPSLVYIPLKDAPHLSVGAMPKTGIQKLMREVLKVE